MMQKIIDLIHAYLPQKTVQNHGMIKLWNPKPAIYFSLLLTPGFGAFIHYKNWLALGEQTNAKESLHWLLGSIAVILLTPIMIQALSVDEIFNKLVSAVYFLAWLFLSANKQNKYIKSNNIAYQKRAWAPPIFATSMLLIVIFLLYITAAWFILTSA